MLQIGSRKLENRLVMAPMAGITNLAFRRIVKRFGPGLVTTEMVSAAGLVRGRRGPGRRNRTFDYLATHPDEKPLSVQVFGTDPDIMARAAEMVVDAGADIVDINMGCPARKVVRNGAGGALLRDRRRAAEIVSAVRRAIPVPLTVKMRSGWSPRDPLALDIALAAQDSGADAVTLHPRFVKQGFSGRADWGLIARFKEHLRIPLIGNGDVLRPALALEMRAVTGCDGVMIGRGAIGNPWIFRNILDLEEGRAPKVPSLPERKALILEHFGHLSREMGELRAARMMRGLLLWYTKGLPHSARFRGALTSVRDLDTMISAVDRFFSAISGDRTVPGEAA